MKLVINDGGRAAAGYSGSTRDCVTRAIAIASGLPYSEVYDALALINESYRGRRSKSSKGRTASHGIVVQAKAFKEYMVSLGFTWVPTMQIGSGCQVHLRREELPMGRIVVAVSRHLVAVIDGVMHDISDPSRGGTRCVYGYWKFSQGAN